MRKTSAILRAAVDRIRVPTSWTQGSEARDAAGREVPPEHAGATCFCIDGALILETGPGPRDNPDRRRVNDDLAFVGWSIRNRTQFNDGNSHGAVIRRAERIAAELEAHGM